MSTVLLPIRRVAVVLLAGAAMLLLGAAPAWAHTELESSTPAENSKVDTAPTTVTLTFSEDVPADQATVTVTGPGGTEYAAGKATGRGDTLTVPLKPLGAAGAYTVEYRVISDDGHPVSGTVPFTLTTPGPAATTASPAATPTSAVGAPASSTAPAAATPAPAAATQDGGAPVWPWIVLAVVVIAGGVLVALRRSRS